MISYDVFLDLAIILLVTKVLSLVTKRVNLPQVVGALIGGVMIGPACFGIVGDSAFIDQLAEIGVVMLMFSAGLGTDLKEIKRVGFTAFIVAMIGVIVPLAGGYLVYDAFYPAATAEDRMCALFTGVVLTATSVSITVETLKELGKLQGRVGSVILGAAVIDDILGILVLTFVMGMKDPSVNMGLIGLKTLGFLAATAAIGAVAYYLFKYMNKVFGNKKRLSILSLALCFLMAYLSEAVFGITDITGAYFAGIMFCNLPMGDYVGEKVDTASYLIFSPVFFASIGLKTDFTGITASMIWFAIALLLTAVVTKMIGCGLGAKLCRFSNKESLCIGVGMISRGEVALIVAQKGAAAGMLSQSLFPAIVMVVIVTTLVTPVLLKLVFHEKAAPKPGVQTT